MRLFTILAALCAALTVMTGVAHAGQAAPAPPAAPSAPATPEDGKGRIVGGENAPPGHAPWAVEIYTYGAFPSHERHEDGLEATHHNPRTFFMNQRPDWDLHHFCGGVLIAHNWVLTAGHCLEDGAFMKTSRIRIGSQNIDTGMGSSCKPLRLYPAPQGDVALIRIDQDRCRPAPQPGTVLPIRLLGLSPDDQTAATFNPRTQFTAYGWGMTKVRPVMALGVTTASAKSGVIAANVDPNSADLKQAELYFVPRAPCAAAPGYAELIVSTQICAGVETGKDDICNGDSGGPLVMQQGSQVPLLVGIVEGTRGCGLPNAPGLFEYVPAYLPWIERTLGGQNNARGQALGRALLLSAAPPGGT